MNCIAERKSKMTTNNQTTTWPELAEGLYAFLTGRGATIEYVFDNMEVYVPSSTHPDAPAARWKVNGGIKIRTSEGQLGRSS
jgi:hypothetical protein